MVSQEVPTVILALKAENILINKDDIVNDNQIKSVTDFTQTPGVKLMALQDGFKITKLIAGYKSALDDNKIYAVKSKPVAQEIKTVLEAQFGKFEPIKDRVIFGSDKIAELAEVKNALGCRTVWF